MISSRAGVLAPPAAAAALLFALPAAPPSHAGIFLNEINLKGVPVIEFYNDGEVSEDLESYIVEVDGVELDIAGIIPPGGYLAAPSEDSFSGCGGEVAVRRRSDHATVDSVSYGNQGGAPAPPRRAVVQPTMARWEDGVRTGDHARDWTVDFTPTLGLPNDPDAPALGRDVVFNEIAGLESAEPVVLELYNLGGGAVSLEGWIIVQHDFEFTLTGALDPGASMTFAVPFPVHPGDVFYLFDAAGVRVEQLGAFEEPPHDPGLCVARIPDGAGPNDGFDWLSSGGGVTLFRAGCTLAPPVGASVPEATGPAKATSWSSLKRLHR